VELLRPSSLDELDGASNNLLLAGGTEVVPLLRDGILQADTLVDVRGIVPRGICATRPGHAAGLTTELCIGAGTTLAELEVDPQIPDALREACRLAASPQLRNMGSLGGNLLQSTRCWYWRLKYPCRLHGGDRCHAAEGEHREHAIFANDFCASAHPSDLAAALLALDARVRTSRRELGIAELYRLPDEDDRATTTLAPGEVILEIEVSPVEASVYLKAMDRKRWSFPQVGVAAARTGAGTRIALAGVAPLPWLLSGPEEIDGATPLPRTAWKVDVARALVGRALAQI
jgi:xanthine dehydrogenase YagS FAD-binding subunit